MRAVIGDHLLHLFARQVGKQILEQIEQMAADVAPQEVVGNVVAARGGEHQLDGAANVGGGVDQVPSTSNR